MQNSMYRFQIVDGKDEGKRDKVDRSRTGVQRGVEKLVSFIFIIVFYSKIVLSAISKHFLPTFKSKCTSLIADCVSIVRFCALFLSSIRFLLFFESYN